MNLNWHWRSLSWKCESILFSWLLTFSSMYRYSILLSLVRILLCNLETREWHCSRWTEVQSEDQKGMFSIKLFDAISPSTNERNIYIALFKAQIFKYMIRFFLVFVPGLQWFVCWLLEDVTIECSCHCCSINLVSNKFLSTLGLECCYEQTTKIFICS